MKFTHDKGVSAIGKVGPRAENVDLMKVLTERCESQTIIDDGVSQRALPQTVPLRMRT